LFKTNNVFLLTKEMILEKLKKILKIIKNY
jgi:hypothetical protein